MRKLEIPFVEDDGGILDFTVLESQISHNSIAQAAHW